MAVTGGELVIRALERAGVDVAFGINGAHVDSMYQAALDRSFRIVDTRHEMNAGHAAEGYARAGHRLGVALLTAGGGFTNAVTSIANAYLDRTPVLYIAASGPLAVDETNTLQAGIDQVAIATPITRWAHRITRAELIPRLLAQAIRIATQGPRGPVLIDIPWDVLTAAVDDDLADEAQELGADSVLAAPGADAVSRILDGLAAAERPVLIAGSELVRSEGGAALRRLAERTGTPLFSDTEALGAIRESPLSYGLLQGLFGLDEGERPDRVILLGLRFGLATAHGSGILIPTGSAVVQIDSDARELGRLQPIELGVLADAGAAAAELAEAAARRGDWPDRSAWQRRLRDLVDGRFDAVTAQAVRDDRIHPMDAVTAIAETVPAGSVVVADGALTYLWLSETISRAPVADYLCHGYLGSMGVGVGTALGAQAADTGRPVVLVTGDGAVGYSLAEFDSMVRAGLPVVVVVLNNRAWGATLHAQELLLGPDRVVNNRLENGSYSAVARALGADGINVTELADLVPALESALVSGRPTCIDVQVSLAPVPPEENVIMGGKPF
ncbi:thiamine pyrophosphate-binding protein [Cnuibacter physcomitrellae]|uniref:Thiamine pyrophosphate-binding protein n=1 Tax=Cnuibacter physcomitrellae TaxID=1619308 RepID=A0A1X9LQK5_9MICO|nr:thiamine pyrophosphate-binding protein [Cnuibacter physcomitrellae]ARJ04180.1 thiamine pyrophosphate-binding protein [Cnuibacter physcomitrellae]